MSCSYILDINSLLVISFGNISSYSVNCFFILLMTSFAVKKLFSLIRYHLFIFAFVSFALVDRSRKALLCSMSKCILCMFSSRTVMVSGLKFRSLIHLEFIFVNGIRKCFKWCKKNVLSFFCI